MAKKIDDPASAKAAIEKAKGNAIKTTAITTDLFRQIKQGKVKGIIHVPEKKGPGSIRLNSCQSTAVSKPEEHEYAKPKFTPQPKELKHA